MRDEPTGARSTAPQPAERAHDGRTRADAARGGVWDGGRRRLTVGLVFTVTLVAFESLAVSAVMPAVEDDLGGLALYGWVFSGFFLGQLLGIVLAGEAIDRRPMAQPFAAGLGLFTIGLVVAGAAPSMGVLVAARVVQGIGAGAIPAIAYASVGRGYEPAVRPRVFAIFSTAWIVPSLVGPAAATAVADALSWRWVFLAILPFVAVAAAIALPVLPGGHPTDAEALAADHARTRRAVGLAAGAALVLGGLTSGSLVAGAALVLAGVPIAARAFVGLVPAGTARAAPGLPAAIAARGWLTFPFFGVNAFVPLALTDVRDQPTWVGGLALTGATFAWTAAAWVQQRAVHTAGPRRLVGIGFALLVVGVAGAVTCLGIGGLPVGVAVALWSVAGFGTGLSYAPISVTVLAVAAPESQGSATASLQLTDVLGGALGTGLVGAVVAAGAALDASAKSSLAAGFGLCAAVAAVGVRLARRLPASLEATARR